MRVEISKLIDVSVSIKWKKVAKTQTYKPEFKLVCEDENTGEEKEIILTKEQLESICDNVELDNESINFMLTPDDTYSTEISVYWNEDQVRDIIEEAYGII